MQAAQCCYARYDDYRRLSFCRRYTAGVLPCHGPLQTCNTVNIAIGLAAHINLILYFSSLPRRFGRSLASLRLGGCLSTDCQLQAARRRRLSSARKLYCIVLYFAIKHVQASMLIAKHYGWTTRQNALTVSHTTTNKPY